MIRTPEQYVESLRDGRVVYQDGARVPDVTKHPLYKQNVERMASEYLIARQPEHRALFNVVEKGEEYAFVFHPPRTGEDLQRRREIIQVLNRAVVGGTKFTGIDALNGVALAAHHIDRVLGTEYGKRIDAYRTWCQRNDPGICVAMSDPKGHRALHAEDPRQKHQDFYLRIADRGVEGIRITGCKLHITDAFYANELICVPSRAHTESGKDYALA